MELSNKKIALPSGAGLDFSGPALIMAIINCNEDSFYAPSRALGEKAAEMALKAEEDGASIIDFGAESTKPGSSYITKEEELERLIPSLLSFRRRSSLPVSVDTRKAVVAKAALDAGADIINDISALEDDPGMAGLCAKYGAAIVLMHKKGNPLTMRETALYGDMEQEIKAFFGSAVERALAGGISGGKIILDPGFGFGKTPRHDLEILRLFTHKGGIAEIFGRDYPVMAGVSRKSFIGEITGRRDAEDRLPGTLAANCIAILGGADIIRVHDVKEHKDLAKMLFELRPGN